MIRSAMFLAVELRIYVWALGCLVKRIGGIIDPTPMVDIAANLAMVDSGVDVFLMSVLMIVGL